jgi:bacterioferritin
MTFNIDLGSSVTGAKAVLGPMSFAWLVQAENRIGGSPVATRTAPDGSHPTSESKMQGNPDVIELLNEVLTSELTAINQYFIHYRMLENWGYVRLAKKKREESIEEMNHADRVISRILFLEGHPNMQRLSPVRVGEDPVEQHQLDLALELEALERLNRGIALAREKADNGTRALLEHILKEEEDSVDWLEAQLHLIRELGKERYLAEQLKSSS